MQGVDNAQPFMASDEEMTGAFHGGDDMADDFLFVDNAYDPYHDVGNAFQSQPLPASPINATTFDDQECGPPVPEPMLPQPPIIEVGHVLYTRVLHATVDPMMHCFAV